MLFKKTLLLGVILFSLSVGVAYAKSITVEVKYQSGNPCKQCAVNSNWNFDKVFTNRYGVAHVDVGSASRRITIFVGGKAAACVRPGGSKTIVVRPTTFGHIPVYGNGC